MWMMANVSSIHELAKSSSDGKSLLCAPSYIEASKLVPLENIMLPLEVLEADE